MNAANDPADALAFARRRDRLALALLVGSPRPLRLRGPGELEATFGEARLIVRLDVPGAPRGTIRLASVSLGYAIEGAIGPFGPEARALVLALSDLLERAEANAGAPLDPTDWIDPVRQLHRVRVARWALGNEPAVPALPPCLALGLRPPFPRGEPRPETRALAAPCSRCGASAACEGAVVATQSARSAADDRRSLRALRHADQASAVNAAIAAIAAAANAPIPDAVTVFVTRALERRAEEPDRIFVPLELSVKAEGNRITPAIRVVDYGPVDAPRGTAEAARGRALAASLANEWLPPSAAAATSEFLQLLESARAFELSLGLDAPLVGAGPAALQLYAHLDPNEPAATRALLERALAFAGVDHGSRSAFAALSARPTLLAFSPSAADPRRIKVYVAAPLDAAFVELGVAPCEPTPLRAFAPRDGLLVLETERGELRPRKRDFPCTAHYQDIDRVVDAFLDGLDPGDRVRFGGALDGSAFSVWPTWLSVGDAARTVYFVPR